MSKNTNLSFLTDYITADITNGRIGINNASPTVAFDVTGVAKFSSSVSATSYNATTQNIFAVDGSEKMRITSAGLVGIGATTSTELRSQLTVLGAGQNTSALTDAGATTGTIQINSSTGAFNSGGALTFGSLLDNGTYVPIAALKLLIQNGTGNGSGDLAFSTRASVSATALTERIRIVSGGQVGIGKSPRITGGITLDVAGGIQTTNDSGNVSYINFGQNSDPSLSYTYMQGDGRSSGFLRFHTNDTERMRITSAGFVGIGTSGPNYVTTIADSTWSNGSTVSYLFNIRKAYGVGVVFGCYVGEYSQDSTGFTINQKVFNQAPATTQTFTINNSGNYSFWGSNVSDKRLKRNINYIEDSQLDKIMLLKPATFNKIVDNEINTNIHTGFIAQDILESNIPNLIMGSEETSYGLDYDGILALAVKAIQELKAEIDTLKNK